MLSTAVRTRIFLADLLHFRFDFAYLIRGPRGQTTPLDGLPQTQIFSHRLPQGYTGIVIQVEEGAWDLPAAQRLIKDPMDP